MHSTSHLWLSSSLLPVAWYWRHFRCPFILHLLPFSSTNFLIIFFFSFLFYFCFSKGHQSLPPLVGPPASRCRRATTGRRPSPTFLQFSFFPTTLKPVSKRELNFFLYFILFLLLSLLPLYLLLFDLCSSGLGVLSFLNLFSYLVIKFCLILIVNWD